jgi:hypothetical protein
MGVQRRMYLDGKIGISGSQNSLQRVSQYMAMLDQAMEQVMCLLSLMFSPGKDFRALFVVFVVVSCQDVAFSRDFRTLFCVFVVRRDATSWQEIILKFLMKTTLDSLQASKQRIQTLNPKPLNDAQILGWAQGSPSPPRAPQASAAGAPPSAAGESKGMGKGMGMGKAKGKAGGKKKK